MTEQTGELDEIRTQIEVKQHELRALMSREQVIKNRDIAEEAKRILAGLQEELDAHGYTPEYAKKEQELFRLRDKAAQNSMYY